MVHNVACLEASSYIKLHVKSCHKKNELIKVNEPKKRKSTEVIASSRKNTKNNVVFKKVKRVKC